jgi:hypothetical protein
MGNMISAEGLLVAEAAGPLLGSVQDALDLIGAAFSKGASVIVVPKDRLDPAFFQLSTRLAGEFLQKMVNYKRIFVVIGDFSEEVARSSALRDFIVECNRGKDIFFLPDMEALAGKLSR